jgi:hypothetical protein
MTLYEAVAFGLLQALRCAPEMNCKQVVDDILGIKRNMFEYGSVLN